MSTTGGLLGIETTTQEFAQKLAEILPVTIAIVALWDRPSFSLTIKAVGTARPLDVPLPLWSRVSLATAPAHRAAFERQEPIFLDLESASATTAREEVARALVPDLRAIYLLPIRISDETVGVLGLGEMRSAEREPMSSEKRERCRTILEEFLATSAHAWEAGRLRQQVRAMASLLRMVRETLDARTSEDVLAMCTSEAGGWLGAPVRAILFRVGSSGDITVAAKYRFPEPVTSADGAQLMLALARNRTQAEWSVGVASVADDPLDALRAVMPEGGRWTRITLPLMNVGQMLGLICLYIEDELQLTEWELEVFPVPCGDRVARVCAGLDAGGPRSRTGMVRARCLRDPVDCPADCASRGAEGHRSARRDAPPGQDPAARGGGGRFGARRTARGVRAR